MSALSSALLDLGLQAASSSSTSPSSSSMLQTRHVLVCGDADFAYTTALRHTLRSRSCDDVRIFSSSYEPEAELIDRYPQAAAAITESTVASPPTMMKSPEP